MMENPTRRKKMKPKNLNDLKVDGFNRINKYQVKSLIQDKIGTICNTCDVRKKCMADKNCEIIVELKSLLGDGDDVDER